jgi:phenylalanyl-tRNA synthetase beta chain
MRVSYSWLRELLPALDAPAAEVAERLSAAGLAVDGISIHGAGADSVLLARVRAVAPHPKRSNLRLVTVDRGAGHEQQVVCGAANVPEPGGMVVLAPLGARLPGQEPLAPREIAGVRSEGMLCSERELGLAEESDGILILPSTLAPAGTSLAQAVPGASDTVFELDVTPNRPDALGHVGIARELAALYQLEFRYPEPGQRDASAGVGIESLIEVQNLDLDRCPHYGAAAALDVNVGESPAWLRWRLTSLGIRPISNVVDITNLLLMEFGQPMHAFDLDRVRGQRIVVRRARQGEPFTTLDGVARQLDADDLVICDAEAPSALAGVMGGQDSEIRAETRRVLLECAYFEPRAIRRSARRHGMHTESSHRFERGVDWAQIPRVLERALQLLTELCGAKPATGALHAHGALPVLPAMTLRSARIDQLLGAPVPFDEALAILRRLGFAVGNGTPESAEIQGASHRPDVSREVDLIEEVTRVRGLHLIPARLPAIAPQEPRSTGQLELRATLEAKNLGLREALSYAFVAPRELEAVRAPAAVVTIVNPLSEERSVMRTSLLPGLLEALSRARRHGETSVRLFSVGARFLAPSSEPASPAARKARPTSTEDGGILPEERPSFAAVLAGPRPAYLTREAGEFDVYDAKGLALELAERITGQRATVRHAGGSYAHLHPRAAADVLVGDTLVGRFGSLHPDVIDALDLGAPAQVIELDLAAVESLGRPTPRYRPIPRLPAVTRDVAFELDEQVTAGEVEQVILRAAGELCESVELFDLFRGGALAKDRRSLAFRLIYRDPRARSAPDQARTLTDKEVDEQQAQVVRAVTTELGGVLRG